VFGKDYPDRLKLSFRPPLQSETSTEDREKPCLNDKMLRHELAPLKISEMVLAKWPGDGFYYECRVHSRISPHLYQLENMLADSKCDLKLSLRFFYV
jgi:hypothetical protein